MNAGAAPVLYVAEPPPQYLARPPLVVDCSALAGVLFQEPWMELALQRLSGHRLCAPHLLQAEICNVAVKKARQGAAETAAAGLSQWSSMAIELTDFDVEQALALASVTSSAPTTPATSGWSSNCAALWSPSTPNSAPPPWPTSARWSECTQ